MRNKMYSMVDGDSYQEIVAMRIPSLSPPIGVIVLRGPLTIDTPLKITITSEEAEAAPCNVP